ncbi:MAG: family transcriptional regulator [Xanthobacteraceae bacterium]|jgi:putative transcriptional regulator|nr:family transcriptional regulator [Xanthobacteraceae bacterium]
MLRVRLKADGRIVEILPDGSERALPPNPATPQRGQADTAINARRIRGATRLSQTAFASRLGVPVETVRNWEQGKRAPRGPARALLKIIDQAPDTAFLLLETGVA